MTIQKDLCDIKQICFHTRHPSHASLLNLSYRPVLQTLLTTAELQESITIVS